MLTLRRSKWAKDLCDYYGVSPKQALALGTRAKGRRHELPGSSTCQPVSGKTLEEIWESRPRETEIDLWSFWQEVGAWFSFRQIVHHRRSEFSEILARLPKQGVVTVVEYGCGVAPVSNWLYEHKLPGQNFRFWLLDVRSEHRQFGTWRLQRRRDAAHDYDTTVLMVNPDDVPRCDAVTVLETFEHLPDPWATIYRIWRQLYPGGLLWEDYEVTTPGGPNLAIAQAERPRVMAFLQERFHLLSGNLKDGRRCWRKR